MASKLGEAFIAITTKDETDAGFEAARVKANSFVRDITQGLAQGVGQALAAGIGNLIRGAVDEIGKSVKAASNLNETLSKTGAVFDENAKDIVEWSQTTSRALGVSQQAALQASSSLGNMFKQLGFSGNEAANFSKNLVGVSADLVAFHNVAGGTEEVLDAIQSAFRGEYDPIQRYIPIITAAAVQQQALADTGKTAADQLTSSEKAAAAYTIILDNLGDAAGAAAREIDSAASQQRIFDARIADAQAQFGQIFVPLQQEFYKGLNELLDQIAPYGPKIIQVLADSMAAGISALVPVMGLLHSFFAYWMEPQSPPRFLKDITKWGQDTLKEYMKGWAQPDFEALQTLGSGIESVLRSFAATGSIGQTDLVGRIFGSGRAIVDAVNDFRNLGYVTASTMDNIIRQAGPAGDAVSGLVEQYFNLQSATQEVSDAQNELNNVTRRYSDALDPINQQLDAVKEAQKVIRDNQRLEALGKDLQDPRATADQKQLDRLEIQQIQLERQATAIGDERDAAVGAAQAKIDAAKKEEDARKGAYDAAQATLQQQNKTNALLAEEINLRERLASEALSAEEKARRELEARLQKEQSELDHIADAQLRYQLATTDTAGQLAIWKDQLAKAAVGSVEYFEALTQVYLLTKKFNDEMAKTAASKKVGDQGGGGIFGDLFGGVDLTKIKDALDAVFGAATGKTGTVKLSGVWKEIADNISSVADAAVRAGPLIQTLIDIVTGKDTGKEGDPDPFGDNWWLKDIVPTFRTVKADLDTFQAGGWSALWTKLKKDITDFVNGADWDKEGPQAFAFYSWIVDTLIPAIDLLAAGDWKDAFTILGAPINAFVDGALQKGSDLMKNFFDGMTGYLNSFGTARRAELLDILNNLFGWLIPDAPNRPPPDPNKGQPQDVLPPNNNSSFPGTGFPNLAPLTAGAASSTSSSNTYYIEQHIGMNGDFGGARQGAESGIREALINRRINS